MVASEVYRPHAGVGICRQRAVHRVHQSTLLPQCQVQSAAQPRAAQDIVGQEQCQLPAVVAPVGLRPHHDVCLVGVLFHHPLHHLVSAFHRLSHVGASRLRQCFLRNVPQDVLHFYVAVDKEHRPVRGVQPVGIPADVLAPVLTQQRGIAKDVPSQRVTVEEQSLKVVVYQFRGRVVVALYLVHYHFHLLVHLFLRVQAVEHHVEQHVHGSAEVLALAGAVVHRLFLAGEGVQVSAYRLHARYYPA